MDHSQLLSSTVEIGLDLLEKDGSFIPFCRAVNAAGETFLYTTKTKTSCSSEQAFNSVLILVKKEIPIRGLIGLAFCFDSRVRLSDSEKKVPAIEVELHYKWMQSANWYFLYNLEGGNATVLEYYTKAGNEDLFA